MRRKFFEAKGSADVALAGIDSLFNIERTLRDQDITPKQFTQSLRQQAETIF
jgi:hypothetical protein